MISKTHHTGSTVCSAEQATGGFGPDFSMLVEPAIYAAARSLSSDYTGAFWQFIKLEGGAFYMAPRTSLTFAITSANAFRGCVDADTFGLLACLAAFGRSPQKPATVWGRRNATQFASLLKEMLTHPNGALLSRSVL